MIIGVAGKAGSGKDTFADFLLEDLKSKGVKISKYNLALPIKAFINDLMGWDDRHAYGELKEVIVKVEVSTFKEFKEAFDKVFPTVDISYHKLRYMWGVLDILRMNKDDNISPRMMYQWFGTECMREIVHDDIWLQLIPNVKGEVVLIPDIRFPNEAAYLREKGSLIHVKREGVSEVATHISEQGIPFMEGDITIDNNGSLSDLRSSVEQYIKEYL